MPSLPTIPQRTWLERLSLGLGIVVAVVGLGSLVAWWLRLEALLLPVPDTAPLRANSALAFGVLGLVLVAFEFGTRRWARLAWLPALIAALTIAEYVFGRALGIDELLTDDYLFINTQHPGRMGVVIATAILCCSFVLALRATKRAASARILAEATVGSVMAAAGLSTLLGHAAGLEAVYKWGSATTTGPVAGATLLLLGCAVVLLAWRERMELDGEPPSWSPMPAIVGCLTVTVILSVGLQQRETAYLKQAIASANHSLAAKIQGEFETQANRVERLARQYADATPQGWQTLATQHYEEARVLGAVAVAFVGPDRRTAVQVPADGLSPERLDHARDPFRDDAINRAGRAPFTAVISGTTTVSGPNNDEKLAAVIYAPVIVATQVAGYVAAEYAYDDFFRAITIREGLHRDYHVTIDVGGKMVSRVVAPDPTRLETLGVSRTYSIADRHVRVALVPSQSAAAVKDRGYLPELALFAGVGITLLLGLSVHLARRARAGQRAAELSSEKLFDENEERRRIEARLKVSDERLRLALDSTQIGIFEWSVGNGHVYYSPGLWAMLGYDHARMPTTVEAWQSLIHPDDLPLYRRRIESQLNGMAGFIEPEYRVRAQSGDWRWVYTRSKSVAVNPDGRPTRMIGTVQDITARREAEFALRESQAEARKLSLVAAKTDNPVMIGAPDGKVEWANEAFCRMMEYRLEEVIGRLPAQFMVGPDTDVRTFARVRSALARGQGVSTDLVSYSKSGRKYYLHLEVQPVVGTTGEVENFIAVGTDITTRVETETQLRRAKAEADDASRAKSEFLASMSHEIRTPMNGVIGMTSLLMETTLNPEQRDYVNTIRSSGEALLTIINDILDFSKIESGKMELERAPFELTLCLEEALDLFALQTSAKKLEIGYHVAPDVPAWLIGDVTRLRQVLVNLVNNAVKFTSAGSISVEVRCAPREQTPGGFTSPVSAAPPRLKLEFTVRDTGIGIPAERIDRLFKAFSQVDSSTTRKYGGTGLGLAICQRLTQLMGGDIRVESNGGRGSAFIFTIQTAAAPGGGEPGLPLLPAALRGATVLCVEDNPVTQARLQTFFETNGARCVLAADPAAALATIRAGTPPPTLLVVDADETVARARLEALAELRCPRLLLYPFGQTPPAAPADGIPFGSTSKPLRSSALLQSVTTLFQSARGGIVDGRHHDRPIGEEIPLEVLLAEDNVVNQKVALRFLERLGYRAHAVVNGAEAVQALEKRSYDLVLMDLQMPEMDGFEAARQIRMRLPADRQPKIVALTANAMQGDRELCLAAGMDDHVAKPVKMHEIAAAIRKHFGKPEQTSANATGRLIG